jgi:D-alanyl-lipoteichoic acid acyltransferase DltB (MBOAT superfamily)
LYTGIVFNAGVLALFKYANVFVDGIKAFTIKFGFSVNDTALNILIPLGISFYTFRLMSYLLDIYNNRISPSSSVVNFALYIAFFPQILSGPIERPKPFLEKLAKPRQITQQIIVDGAFLILVGLY